MEKLRSLQLDYIRLIEDEEPKHVEVLQEYLDLVRYCTILVNKLCPLFNVGIIFGINKTEKLLIKAPRKVSGF
jgi:hypothetical protein